MSLIDAQKGMTDLLPCNEQCGGNYDAYSFTQNDTEVVITVPLPQGTSAKQLSVDISTTKLFLSLKRSGGEPPIVFLSGELYKPIKAEESSWSVEEKKLLVVTLSKANLQCEEWWPHVVRTERQIDMKGLKPPSKHVRDLDASTQATVAKMMFDQEQKRKGLPTSEELQLQELMAKAGRPSGE